MRWSTTGSRDRPGMPTAADADHRRRTPSVSVELALDGSPLPGADATAARVINAMATVRCRSRFSGALDLAIMPALTASAPHWPALRARRRATPDTTGEFGAQRRQWAC